MSFAISEAPLVAEFLRRFYSDTGLPRLGASTPCCSISDGRLTAGTRFRPLLCVCVWSHQFPEPMYPIDELVLVRDDLYVLPSFLRGSILSNPTTISTSAKVNIGHKIVEMSRT